MEIIKRLIRNKVGFAGGVFLLVIVFAVIFAPIITPYGPNNSDFSRIYASPSWKHPLGCDSMGRDILTRIIFGGRISLMVSVPAVILSTVLGTLAGVISAVGGRAVDIVVQRLVEVFMSIPFLVAVLVMVSVLGQGIDSLILAIGFLGWARIARLVRGEALSGVEEDYIKAAKSYGASTPRIMLKYLFPNISAPIWVAATFNLAAFILTEASVSFLGYGIQPPTPSWGNMLIAAQELNILTSKLWIWLPPGIIVSVTVIAVNFLGDALRDVLDPRYYVKTKTK